MKTAVVWMVIVLAAGANPEEATLPKRVPDNLSSLYYSSTDPNRPSFGMVLVPLTPQVRQVLYKVNLPPVRFAGGAIVRDVSPESPAHQAGIRELDIVRAIGGTVIADANSYSRVMSAMEVGRPIIMTVYRLQDKDAESLLPSEPEPPQAQPNPRVRPSQRTGRIAPPRRERVITNAAPWLGYRVQVVPCAYHAIKRSPDGCPLVLESARLTHDVIGTPVVELTVKNVATKPVVAFEVEIHCWDRYDRPVGIDGNVAHGISQRTLPVGGRFTMKWPLIFRGNAARVTVYLKSARVEDKTTWTAGEHKVFVDAASQR